MRPVIAVVLVWSVSAQAKCVDPTEAEEIAARAARLLLEMKAACLQYGSGAPQCAVAHRATHDGADAMRRAIKQCEVREK